MNTISEPEFEKLCDDIFRDRREIYAFNPQMSRSEALLWMLMGCLITLLSVPVTEQPAAFRTDDVVELVEKRAARPFDPKIYLDELTRRLEADLMEDCER